MSLPTRLRGDAREHEMFAWAVEQMSAHDNVQNDWVAEDDDARIHWLEANGFARAESHFILFKRSLSGALEGPPLPEGFSIRTSRCAGRCPIKIGGLTRGIRVV